MDIANLTVTEGLWLGVALVGLYFAWENLRESRLDRLDAEKARNGLRAARVVVANGYVFRNRIRLGIFAWWSYLGVMYGLFDPPEIPRLAGLLGLIATAMGWTVIGFQETHERRALRRIITLQESVHEETDAATKITRKAEITAARLEQTAQNTAERLEESVERAASVLDLVERTANNTERIADNTDGLRENGNGQG